MHALHNYYEVASYQYYTLFWTQANPLLCALTASEGAGVGIVDVRSAGVGIAGV